MAKTDKELMDAVIANEPGAFDDLYAKFHTRVRQTVWRLCRPDDIDDVVQGIFLKVYTKAGQFKAEAKLSTWIHRIAVNHAYELNRRKVSRGGDNVVSTDTVYDPTSGGWFTGVDIGAEDPHMEFVGDLDKLRYHIEHLPRNMREMIYIHLEGERLLDFANRKGLNYSSVKSANRRALETLKKRMLDGQVTTVS